MVQIWQILVLTHVILNLSGMHLESPQGLDSLDSLDSLDPFRSTPQICQGAIDNQALCKLALIHLRLPVDLMLMTP